MLMHVVQVQSHPPLCLLYMALRLPQCVIDLVYDADRQLSSPRKRLSRLVWSLNWEVVLVQCKHQLAARSAEALQQCEVVEVPDEVLSEILISS